jgi:hypothetical protein
VSVIVTLRLQADPAKFEEATSDKEAIGRVMGVAKRHGLIAHRWYGGEGVVMAVDEWPDGDSFHAFFHDPEAEKEIGPILEAAGVAAPPDITVWRTLDIGDEYGWDA